MHVPRMICSWFVVLGLGIAADGRAADAAAPADDAIRTLVREWIADHDGVGLSVGVYDNGARRFFNAGVPRLDANQPPSQDTVYEIGSITKAFTGQLLARAVVEGRAALDDDAAKYLAEPYPNLENGGERVRLVHLATMTSQLADNIPDLSQIRVKPGEPLAATRMKVIGAYTQRQFLAQLHRVAPRRPPGSEPENSNVAGMLLGVVLEKVYGAPFEELLVREIEKPLRMGSGVAPEPGRVARGYTHAGEELPPFEARMAHASWGLRYSADDLLRFAMWQLVERDASVKLAHRPGWYTPDGQRGVAFYWIVGDSPAGRRLFAAGGTYGFASVCELYPDAKLATVLLSNKAADGAQESLRALSAKIVEALRPDGLTSPSSWPAASRPAGR